MTMLRIPTFWMIMLIFAKFVLLSTKSTNRLLRRAFAPKTCEARVCFANSGFHHDALASDFALASHLKMLAIWRSKSWHNNTNWVYTQFVSNFFSKSCHWKSPCFACCLNLLILGGIRPQYAKHNQIYTAAIFIASNPTSISYLQRRCLYFFEPFGLRHKANFVFHHGHLRLCWCVTQEKVRV